jgi:hypothetical protein
MHGRFRVKNKLKHTSNVLSVSGVCMRFDARFLLTSKTNDQGIDNILYLHSTVLFSIFSSKFSLVFIIFLSKLLSYI